MSIGTDSKPNGYLICGIPPGASGTGRFFKALPPVAARHNYATIHPRSGTAFSDAERYAISTIEGAKVIALHPQTIGLTTFIELVKNNTFSMYVLDNSFFCMRSYNHRPSQLGECFDCMYNIENCHSSCSPFPVSYTKEENIDFICTLKTLAPKIKFLCQSVTQENLLKRHFGQDINSLVIGMRTDEFDEAQEDTATKIPNLDIVLHADVVPAKGIVYALMLAKELPDCSFLIPSSRAYVKERIAASGCDVSVELPNVVYQDMRWEGGLKQCVQRCRLVLCPSVWSSSVEGALMKSLYYNGNVAVFDTRYGFQREIPGDMILRLNENLTASADAVKAFLQSGNSFKERVFAWIKEYNATVDLDKIFLES